MTSPALIRAVTFESDAVAIEYCIPAEDARLNGILRNHVVLVPADNQYLDLIEDALAAVRALLDDVLEDIPLLEAVPSIGPVTDNLQDLDMDDED